MTQLLLQIGVNNKPANVHHTSLGNRCWQTNLVSFLWVYWFNNSVFNNSSYLLRYPKVL